jgi:hypothetical protein
MYFGFIVSHVASDLVYLVSFVDDNIPKLNIPDNIINTLSFYYIRGTTFIKLNNIGYVNFMHWNSVSRPLVTLYCWS